MTDIQAALGASQLGRIDEFIQRRNEIALTYRRELANLPVELPPGALDGWRHGYHLFPIAVDKRAEVFSALRSRGSVFRSPRADPSPSDQCSHGLRGWGSSRVRRAV